MMHLGAFMRPAAIHTGAWRFPGADPNANFSLVQMRRSIRRLEEAKFDAFFMADHLALLNMPPSALRRSHTVTSFEPFTLLSTLAGVTERIGLVATASTSFEEPYHVARRFASLDHISDGRAGWNVVTTANPDAALNFSQDRQAGHDTRYARAREFFDVVTGLWDSFADDAFIRNAESGIFLETSRVRPLDHAGPSLRVRGPLNIARPVQGWPVIFQAGASVAGRQLAAETAEVIFGNPVDMAASRAFYADVRRRMAAIGRDHSTLRFLPAAFILVADTLDEAKRQRELLDSLVDYESGIGALNAMLGFDVSDFDPDGLLPDIPETEGAKTQRQRMVDLARAGNLTIRQLAQQAGSYSGFAFVGTPASIADEMEEWLEADASDGFNVMFPWLPGGLDAVVDKLVPELQRRSLFRQDYVGRTLRDHLGLARPANAHFVG
jgi:FMN-dependent oxidoreductase (nitrilotriacetate monooxygenase family)